MQPPRHSRRVTIGVGRNTLKNGRDHVGNLSTLGVDDKYLDTLEEDIRMVEAEPTENQNREILKGYTRSKDGVVEACEEWCDQLRLRLSSAFGKSSQEYNSFPSARLTDARGNELKMLELMPEMLDLAEKYDEELQRAGQTCEVLERGNELTEQLRYSEDDQEVFKEEKEASTQERYGYLHRIYDMVNHINAVGREVYKDDPVNYTYFKNPWPKYGSNSDDDDAGEI